MSRSPASAWGAVALAGGIAVASAGCAGSQGERQECPPNAAWATCHPLPTLGTRAFVELYARPLHELPPVAGSVAVRWSCGESSSTIGVLRGVPASVALSGHGRIFFSPDI